MHCNNGLNNQLVESLVENKVAEETGDLRYLQDSMYDFVKTLKEIILGEYSPEFFNKYVDEALKLHGSNLEEFLKIPKMGLELRQALNSIDEAIDTSNQDFKDNLVLLLDKFQTTLDNIEYEARDPYDTAVELGFTGTKQEWLKHLEGDSAYEIAVKNGYTGTQAEWLKYIRADGFIQSIQQFATNDSETKVQIPDYGTINSLQGYIKELFENGGLPATPFSTKALMTASALVDGKYAMVTDDSVADDNGLYVKTAGVWVKSKHQGSGGGGKLLTQEYKSAAFDLSNTYINLTSGVATANTAYKATTKLPVQPNTVYKVFSPNAGNAGNAWFDKSGKYISGFNTGLVAESVTSPAAAAFVALSVKNADAVNAYFKSAEPKFSIKDLMPIVNTHKDDSELNSKIAVNTNDIALLKKPMADVTVVNSLKELIALNPEGEADKAYPIGRRVYDHSLRKTVTADGSFWRLEDGRPANVARRVYVYPDWLEIKKALPTYAKKHTPVYNINSDSFDVSSGDKWGLSADISYAFGDKRLRLKRTGASTFGNVVFADLTTLRTLNDYVIFDYHISSTSKTSVRVNLLDEAGNVLFYNVLNYVNSTGELARRFYETDHVRAEVRVSDFTATFGGPSLTDVKKIGISISNTTDATSEIYLGSVDTATFKPMITLRFDDQRQSVYDNAYPIMEANGLTGLIAVVTGTPKLGNSPNYVYGDGSGSMSKAQLLEVQSKGWDLVSHTHVHENLANKPYDYIRADYKASRDYLRDELNVGDIASSFIVSPFSVIGASQAAAQREFFDAQVSGVHLNSHMPRQPTGTWQLGSLWQSLGCDVGDNNDDANALIAIAQNAIDEQRWSIVMMHDILPTLQGTTSTTISAFTGFCEWLNANRDKIDVVTVTDVVRRIRPVD